MSNEENPNKENPNKENPNEENPNKENPNEENPNEWMNSDYLLLEECDNQKCKRKCYSLCRIYCLRCGKSNEEEFKTIHHCLDCIGEHMKFIDDDGEDDIGFDLCGDCFKAEPTFVLNNHTTQHNRIIISRNKAIHNCMCCEQYFCYKCRLTSKSFITIPDIMGVRTEEVIRSICKTCLNKFI